MEVDYASLRIAPNIHIPDFACDGVITIDWNSDDYMVSIRST
jgi:hypothetical protein